MIAFSRSIDGASNTILATPEVTAPSTYGVLTPHFGVVRTLSFRKENEDIDPSQDDSEEFSKHSRVFGQNVPLGPMNDVISQFYVCEESSALLVPLCRLIPTNAVRLAIAEASWLIPSFDRVGYVSIMGSFTVSLKGRHGETRLVTQEMIKQWDPIWQNLNTEFEKNLTREWEELRGKLFFVWDGNHHLKTWMKRIEDGM
ncbi:hypothetical protein L7F22_061788 [Adiantum nelumboides]|nr:hypothetical protein [Adiantum nelumboides]